MGSAKGVGVALTVLGLILLMLSFAPTQQKVFEETFVVPPLSYYYYCTTFDRKVDLTIEVRVLQGGYRDINFWVMPASEFFAYASGNAYRVYTIPSRQRVSEASISWSPPEGIQICFVYDNKFSIFESRTVYSKIVATYPGPTGELMWTGLVLMFVGMLIVAGSGDKKGGSPQATSGNQ